MQISYLCLIGFWISDLITVRNGNSTSDTICQCNVSGGYHENRSVTARSAQPLQSYHCQYSPSVTSASSGCQYSYVAELLSSSCVIIIESRLLSRWCLGPTAVGE